MLGKETMYDSRVLFPSIFLYVAISFTWSYNYKFHLEPQVASKKGENVYKKETCSETINEAHDKLSR